MSCTIWLSNSHTVKVTQLIARGCRIPVGVENMIEKNYFKNKTKITPVDGVKQKSIRVKSQNTKKEN